MSDADDGWRKVRFDELDCGDEFWAKDWLWKRVDKCTDRQGGYNAQQVGTGRRELFFAHEVVEVCIVRD